MAKREKLERITSPDGIARYPKLNEPDDYKGKRAWKVDLILNPDDDGVQEYLDKIQAASDAAYELAKASLEEKIENAKNGRERKRAEEALAALKQHVPFFPEEDEEGEETGNIVVRFKKNATYKDKKTGEVLEARPPFFFDAMGRPIKANRVPSIWGGSILSIAADISPPFHTEAAGAGVSLWLAGVQIVDLKSGSGASAASMGFEKRSGGFSAASDLGDGGDAADVDDGDDGDEYDDDF